jgi:N-methylhydantoinase A
MADAIREITINEGVDPREATIVAGGGAAGMTIVPIVDAIGCTKVLIPPTAGALSAAGGHFTDVIGEFTVSCATTVAEFDRPAVLAALDNLAEQTAEFVRSLDGGDITEFVLDHIVEARYTEQIWDLEIVFEAGELRAPMGELVVREAFDREHQRVFAVSAPTQDVELLTGKIRARGLLSRPELAGPLAAGSSELPSRSAVFDAGPVETRVLAGAALPAGFTASGPVLVQLPTTTIVVPPAWNLAVATHGSFVLTKEAA